MITSIKTQAVLLGSSYRLPIHILYRSIPGRLGGDVSFADAIIAKYKSANEQELPSADFVYPKYGERDAGDALTELSRQLILMNRIRIQMNIRNYRIMQRYSLTVSARCDQLLNMLRMQTNAYSGVSQESVRELMQIHRELKERINESASRDSLVQMHAGVSNVREDEESTLIMKILTAASRGNGTRERYMRRLIDRMHSIGAAESRNSYESASRALLQKAETELFRLPERENGTSMTLWNSDAARQFFWRIQRTPEPLRSVFLDAGGFSSLVTFEKVLKGMDTEAFRAFAEPLIERISYSLSRSVPAAGTASAAGEYGDREWLRLYHSAENAAAVSEADAAVSDGMNGADGSAGRTGLRGADGAAGQIGRMGVDGAVGQDGLQAADVRSADAFHFFDRLSEEEWDLFRSEMVYADQGGQLKKQVPELYRALTEGRSTVSAESHAGSSEDAGVSAETGRSLLPQAAESTGTGEYSEEAGIRVGSERSSSRVAVENILRTMDRDTYQTVVRPLLLRISGSVSVNRFSKETEAAGESGVPDLFARYNTVEQVFASLTEQTIGKTEFADRLFERQSEEVWEMFCSELIHADREEALKKHAPELYRELIKAQVLTETESSPDVSINNTEILSSRAVFENTLTTMDRETFRTVVYPLLQRMTENAPEDRIFEEGKLTPGESEDDDKFLRYHAVERVFASLADRTGEREGQQGAEGSAGRSGQQGAEGQAGRSGRQGAEGHTGYERAHEPEGHAGREGLPEPSGSVARDGLQESTGFERQGGLPESEYFGGQHIQENLSDYTDRLIERQSEEVWELFCTELIYADREGQLKTHVPELYQALTAGQNPTVNTSERIDTSSSPHTIEKKEKSADYIPSDVRVGTEALSSREVVENIFTTMDQETFYHVVRPLMQRMTGGDSVSAISEEMMALTEESEAADRFIRYDTAERVFAALTDRTRGLQGAEGHAGREGLRGAEGTDGHQELQGMEGPGGRIGQQGAEGLAGREGLRGAEGTEGYYGSQGTEGPGGRIGQQGAEGHAGREGLWGAEGTDGHPGLQGMEGLGGLPGLTGSEGFAGREGLRGTEGSDGRLGRPGTEGPGGLTGQPGAKGLQGRDGLQGAEGFDGRSRLQSTLGSGEYAGRQAPEGELRMQENLSEYTDRLFEQQPEEIWELFCTELIYADKEGELRKQAPELYEALTRGQSTVETENRAVVLNILRTMDQETFRTVVRPLLQEMTGSVFGAGSPEDTEMLSGESEAIDRDVRYNTVERVFAALSNRAGGRQGEEGFVGREGLPGAQGPAGREGQPGTVASGEREVLPGAQGPAGREGRQGIAASGRREDLSGAESSAGWESLKGIDTSVGQDGLPGAQGFVGQQGLQGSEGVAGRGETWGADGFTGPDDLQGMEKAGNLLIPEKLSEYTDRLFESQSEEVWQLFCTELIYADQEGELRKQAPELYRALTEGLVLTGSGSSMAGSRAEKSHVTGSESTAAEISALAESLSSRGAVEMILRTMDQETFQTVVRPILLQMTESVFETGISEESAFETSSSEIGEQGRTPQYHTAEMVLAAFEEKEAAQEAAVWNLFCSELIHADQGGNLRKQAPELYRILAEGQHEVLNAVYESAGYDIAASVPERLPSREAALSILKTMDRGTYNNVVRPLLVEIAGPAFHDGLPGEEENAAGESGPYGDNEEADLLQRDQTIGRVFAVLADRKDSFRETDIFVDTLTQFFEEHTDEDWELFRSELIQADRDGELIKQMPELYHAFAGDIPDLIYRRSDAGSTEGESTSDGMEITGHGSYDSPRVGGMSAGSTASDGAGAGSVENAARDREAGETVIIMESEKDHETLPKEDRTKEILREKELLYRILREERGTLRILRTLIIEAVRNIAIIRENQKEFMSLAESIMNLTSEQWHEFKQDVRILHKEDLDIRQLIPETILQETISKARFRSLENDVHRTEDHLSQQEIMQEGIRMSSEKMELLRILQAETNRHDTVFTDAGRKLFLNTVLRESDAGRLIRPSFRELSSEGRESWRNFMTELLHLDRQGTGSGSSAGAGYFGKLAEQYGLAAGSEGSGTQGGTRREAAMHMLTERRNERILPSEDITERWREAERIRNTETQVFRLLAGRPESLVSGETDTVPAPIPPDMTVQRTAANREAAEQARNAERALREAERQMQTESHHDIEFETVRHTVSEREGGMELKGVTEILDRHEREIAGLLKAQKAGAERDLPREVMKQINERMRMERLRGGI